MDNIHEAARMIENAASTLNQARDELLGGLLHLKPAEESARPTFPTFESLQLEVSKLNDNVGALYTRIEALELAVAKATHPDNAAEQFDARMQQWLMAQMASEDKSPLADAIAHFIHEQDLLPTPESIIEHDNFEDAVSEVVERVIENSVHIDINVGRRR